MVCFGVVWGCLAAVLPLFCRGRGDVAGATGDGDGLRADLGAGRATVPGSGFVGAGVSGL